MQRLKKRVKALLSLQGSRLGGMELAPPDARAPRTGGPLAGAPTPVGANPCTERAGAVLGIRACVPSTPLKADGAVTESSSDPRGTPVPAGETVRTVPVFS